MPSVRAQVDSSKLNSGALLPFELRLKDFELNWVSVVDFRRNARGELGTRTATLGAAGLRAFRQNWIYKL